MEMNYGLFFLHYFLLGILCAFVIQNTDSTLNRGKVQSKKRKNLHHRSHSTQPYNFTTRSWQYEQNEVSSTTIKILAFGDSLTEGMYENGLQFAPYSTKLEELLNANFAKQKHLYQIINDGISGQCVFPEMLNRLPISLEKHSVNLKLVIILGGTNDLRTLDCENTVNLADELVKLHQIAHQKGYRTIVMTIPEADERTSQLPYPFETYWRLWHATNEQLRHFANKNKTNTVLCDLAKDFPMFSLHPEHKDLYWSDNLHPTKMGYERMAELLYATISKMNL